MSRLFWCVASSALLLLTTSTHAVETNDWRGVPRGAFAGPVIPSAGAGDAPRENASVLVSAAAPPLEILGDDVIRFSSSPLMAKRTFAIEAHRVRGGPVTGTITTFTLGQKKWERASVRQFNIKAAEFQRLEAAVDRMMAEPLPSFTGDDNYIVCMEGAYFLTERLSAGQKHWLSGDYGPNYRIAKALLASAGDSRFDPAPPHYCGERG